MARPVVLTKALTAAVVNAIAASQALAAAGNLLISGTLATGGVATLDTQRRVAILSSGDDSGITWTVYGANDAGVAISEQVAGGNGVEVDTVQDFKTITRIASSGALAGTVQVGTNSVGSSPWYVPNTHITPFEVGASFEVLAGAVNATVEITDDAVLMPIPIYQPGYSQALPVATPIGFPGMTSLAAAANSVITAPCLGIRLTINSGTGTGRLELIQSGIRN